MNKIYSYYLTHRVNIGIVVGILCILAGLSNLLIGALISAAINLVSGVLILHDVWTMERSSEEH